MEDASLLKDAIKIGIGLIFAGILGYVIGLRRGDPVGRPIPGIGPDFPALTEASLTEILRSLSQTHRSIHGERARRELQIVITTLGFYAAAVSFKLTRNVPADHIFKWSVLGSIIGLAIAACVYLRLSSAASRINQDIAEGAENAMHRLVVRAGVSGLDMPSGRPARFRWLWESGIVVLGAFVAALIIIT